MNSKKRDLQSFSLKPLAVAVVLASVAATQAAAQSGAS